MAVAADRLRSLPGRPLVGELERPPRFRLLSIALRNLHRRPEQTVLAVVGIALTITVATVVQSIGTGYQVSGAGAYDRAVGSAPVWVVPAGGVSFSPPTGALVPNGPLPTLRLPAAWRAVATVGGLFRRDGQTVAMFGSGQDRPRVARLSRAAGRALRLSSGSSIRVAGYQLRVVLTRRTGVVMNVPFEVARRAVGDRGWITVFPSGSTSSVRTQLYAATGLPVTIDPAQSASKKRGIVYITRGGGGVFTFRDRFSAVLSGQVEGSVLGVIAKLALVLGFVIAVTSFLAAVQERRREFGVLASIGLSDEVLYFFLTEAAVIFLAAYLLGGVIAGVALLIAPPTQLSVGEFLQAVALVLTYLPALGVFAALIPAHRIIQQRPVDLLREATS